MHLTNYYKNQQLHLPVNSLNTSTTTLMCLGDKGPLCYPVMDVKVTVKPTVLALFCTRRGAGLSALVPTALGIHLASFSSPHV